MSHEKLSIRLKDIELTQSEYIDLIEALNLRVNHFEELKKYAANKNTRAFSQQCQDITISVKEKIAKSVEKLDVFTFKPGDVISKFDDDSRPVIVDDIVDCAMFSDDMNGQTESMYVVTEHGMGITSEDPRNYHLLTPEKRQELLDRLEKNGVVYKDGKFLAKSLEQNEESEV